MLRMLLATVALATLTLVQPAPVMAEPSHNRADGDRLRDDGDRHRGDGEHRWRHGPRIGIVLGDGIGYRGCGYWRHECADRYGWGSWRYDRCLARHDC